MKNFWWNWLCNCSLWLMITSTFLGNTRRTRWLCLKREIWYLCSISIVTTAISTTVLAVGDLGFIRWPWTQTLDCSVDSAGSITLQSTSPPTARMTTGPIRSRCIHQAEPASSMLQRTQWHRRAVRKASKQKKNMLPVQLVACIFCFLCLRLGCDLHPLPLGWIRFSFNPCWKVQTSFCCVLCSQFSISTYI